MPYTGPNDPKLPDKVKRQNAQWRKQWVAAYNNSHSDCIKGGGDSKDCENRAFAIATAAAQKSHGPMSKFDDIRPKQQG